MPLSKEKLNALHDYGRLLESLSSSAYMAYTMGQTQVPEELVRTMQDLVEEISTLIEELLAPAP